MISFEESLPKKALTRLGQNCNFSVLHVRPREVVRVRAHRGNKIQVVLELWPLSSNIIYFY